MVQNDRNSPNRPRPKQPNITKNNPKWPKYPNTAKKAKNRDMDEREKGGSVKVRTTCVRADRGHFIG